MVYFRLVFFNLLRFTALLRAKKIIWQHTNTEKMILLGTFSNKYLQKKTQKPIFGGTPALSHGTLVGNHCFRHSLYIFLPVCGLIKSAI